jgi:hypothetical protein
LLKLIEEVLIDLFTLLAYLADRNQVDREEYLLIADDCS